MTFYSLLTDRQTDRDTHTHAHTSLASFQVLSGHFHPPLRLPLASGPCLSSPSYSQSLRAGRQAGDALDILAGDSEVVLLVALAGRRRAPFTPQAPWQGEEQHQLQPGRRPHFPRVAEAISSSATVSALCARGSARWRREGGAGEEKTRWGCDLSTKEEAGEGTEGASLGNFTPKQAYWLYFPCPEPLSPRRLFPDT